MFLSIGNLFIKPVPPNFKKKVINFVTNKLDFFKLNSVRVFSMYSFRRQTIQCNISSIKIYTWYKTLNCF